MPRRKAAESRTEKAIDIEAVNLKIDAYLERAKEENAYSIAGLALALDTDPATLMLWEKGLYREPKDGEEAACDEALARAVKRGKTHVLKWLAESSGSNRQSKDIFLLKSWFDMSEKPGEAEETVPIPDLGTLSELAK